MSLFKILNEKLSFGGEKGCFGFEFNMTYWALPLHIDYLGYPERLRMTILCMCLWFDFPRKKEFADVTDGIRIRCTRKYKLSVGTGGCFSMERKES